jgi:fructose-bisphosphate aldolase class II
MPVVDVATYHRMLDHAKAGRFAYPAINITSPSTISAALAAFAEAGSDGILQVSTGGGEFASGQKVKDAALGAICLAEYVHRVADRYPIHVALHTDHCPANKLDSFLRPLLAETRRGAGGGAAEPVLVAHVRRLRAAAAREPGAPGRAAAPSAPSSS